MTGVEIERSKQLPDSCMLTTRRGTMIPTDIQLAYSDLLSRITHGTLPPLTQLNMLKRLASSAEGFLIGADARAVAHDLESINRALDRLEY